MKYFQSLLFPDENSRQSPLFYFRGNYEKAEIVDENTRQPKLKISAGEKISSKTYYNVFSSKYFKYCYEECFKNIKLRISASGKFLIEQFFSDDIGGWFELTAETDVLIFDGGYYLEKDCVKNNVNIALGICTFKREALVEETMSRLKTEILENQNSPLNGKLKIFIADNAETLNLEKSEVITLLAGENSGGSGGFGRCLTEAKSYGDFTHIIYADDDAFYTADVLIRIFNFLSYVKPEYKDIFIGGSMFCENAPNILYASGEYLSKQKIVSPKKGLNLTLEENLSLSFQEESDDTPYQYMAWWLCAFPIKNNQSNEYSQMPLPYFFQYDDIEFSLRYPETKKINLSGVCVFHSDFEGRFSVVREYYPLRNRLFTYALHYKGHTAKDACLAVIYYTVRNLLVFRYNAARLTLRASRDFRKGLENLSQKSPSALHKEIAANGYDNFPFELSDDYDFANGSEIEGLSQKNIVTKNVKKLFLIGIGEVIAPQNRPLADGRTLNAKKIINYDPKTKTAFITEKKLGRNFIFLFLLFIECLKLLICYNTVKKRNIEFAEKYR